MVGEQFGEESMVGLMERAFLMFGEVLEEGGRALDPMQGVIRALGRREVDLAMLGEIVVVGVVTERAGIASRIIAFLGKVDKAGVHQLCFADGLRKRLDFGSLLGRE